MKSQQDEQPDEDAPEPWEGPPPTEYSGELSPSTGWLAMRELVPCLGASPRTLREVGARLPPGNVVKRGHRLWFKAPVFITEYFRTRLKKVDEEGAPNAQAEKQRWDRIRADLADLELRKRRGELLERAKVQAAGMLVVGEFRLIGEGMERKYGADARRLVDEALDRIEKAIEDCGGGASDGSESGS